MTKIINAHGKEFDFDAVVNLMDDTIRETLHNNITDEITAQVFFDVYCKMHEVEFNEEFEFNKLNPQV
jgi:hypothetical protein